MDQTLAKCKQCGWIHFELSRKQAEKEVDSFNKYYDQLDEEGKKYYSGRITTEEYEHCMRCNAHYKTFRIPTLEDRWDQESFGHTINPIIRRED